MIGINYIIYENDNYKLTISIDENESKIQNNYITKSIDNRIILKYLKSLFKIINEWKNEYIDTTIIDGSCWKLSIIYGNGNKKEYIGRSIYPDNFEAFKSLIQDLIEEVQNG